MVWGVINNNTIIMITQEQINSNICKIQNLLGIVETGEWDNESRAAMKNFQLRINSTGTGDLDIKSVEMLLSRTGGTLESSDVVNNSDNLIDDLDATTDLSEATLKIITELMPPDQYVNDPVSKFEYIFIHHTSGWDNPISVVNDWTEDERGRIGTHYVIGGSSVTGNSANDGVVVKCIPDKYWAYHLGSTSKDGISAYMHKNSIGIELCNFGYLIKDGTSFKTYTGKKVNSSQVLDLGYKFRGYQYWHAYSPGQLNSLKLLLIKLSKQFNIDLKGGLHSWLSSLDKQNKFKAFEYSPEATAGKVKGVLSHSNVRRDKTDVYPHPQLIDLLMDL